MWSLLWWHPITHNNTICFTNFFSALQKLMKKFISRHFSISVVHVVIMTMLCRSKWLNFSFISQHQTDAASTRALDCALYLPVAELFHRHFQRLENQRQMCCPVKPQFHRDVPVWQNLHCSGCPGSLKLFGELPCLCRTSLSACNRHAEKSKHRFANRLNFHHAETAHPPKKTSSRTKKIKTKTKLRT